MTVVVQAFGSYFIWVLSALLVYFIGSVHALALPLFLINPNGLHLNRMLTVASYHPAIGPLQHAPLHVSYTMLLPCTLPHCSAASVRSTALPLLTLFTATLLPTLSTLVLLPYASSQHRSPTVSATLFFPHILPPVSTAVLLPTATTFLYYCIAHHLAIVPDILFPIFYLYIVLNHLL